MSAYVCTQLANDSLNGQQICQTWQELPTNPPILPELTIAEANQIASAIITVLAVAWCFKTLAQFIKEF